ncbi:MAG: hypothetical protein KDE58_24280, partial [Caldilineaceae bacterium]|nr:hypothetical protein [Caldilineaceae bacterium]
MAKSRMLFIVGMIVLLLSSGCQALLPTAQLLSQVGFSSDMAAMPTADAAMSVAEATAEPTEEATEEAMTEATPEPTEEAAEEAMTEATAEPTEEATEEAMA